MSVYDMFSLKEYQPEDAASVQYYDSSDFDDEGKPNAIDDLSSRLLDSVSAAGGNAVISPSCLYQALAMLADVSASDTRGQIVDALGDEREISETVNALSKIEAPSYGCKDFHYSTDASLWVDNSLTLNDDLSNKSFVTPIKIEQVKMGSTAADDLMSEWLSENTGGIFTKGPETSLGDLLVGLCSMHLKDSWTDKFGEGETHVFVSDDGTEAELDFMLDWSKHDLLDREGSITFSKDLSSGSRLVVSLPPEGMALNEYVSSGNAWMNMLLFLRRGCSEFYRDCKIYMPKFDISSNRIDLKNVLTDLGVTRIFGPDADFSPLSPAALMVNEVLQSTKLRIDKEGLEGASYVEILMCTGIPPMDPPEPRTIYVDRPFVVAVVSPDNLPLFVGTVRNPE